MSQMRAATPGGRRLFGLFSEGSVRDADIREYHKAFVTRFVMPSMALMSLLFYVTYFSLENQKMLVMGLCLLVIAGNVYVTSKNRVLRVGSWSIKTRSDDFFDAARWAFNLLVADVALAVTFKPTPAAFVVSWIIIVLSAQADTFQRVHRRPIVAMGLVIGAVLYYRLYPETPPAEYLLVTLSMVAIIVMAAVTENYWIREILAKQDARRRGELAEMHASQLKREALIGGHVRTISHELGNLLGILDLAANMEANQISGRHLDVVRRSVVHAKKISALILADATKTSKVRSYPVRDLADDLDLLLAKEVRQRRIEWRLDLGTKAAEATISECGGGTYFIVHNIVKNAWEAIEARAAAGEALIGGIKGRIAITFALSGTNLILSIEDDAHGMTEAQRAAILAGDGESTKSEGHGLGLKFALAECQKNGFKIEIDSTQGLGTIFRIVIPVISV